MHPLYTHNMRSFSLAAAAVAASVAWCGVRVVERLAVRGRVRGGCVSVRRATPEDARAISRVVSDAYLVESVGDGGRPTAPTAFLSSETRRLNESEALACVPHALVAEEEVSGRVLAAVVAREADDGAAFFGPLGVDPRMQSLGLGSRMVLEAAKWAAGEGADRMRIEVINWRTDVFQWYHRLGFRVVGPPAVFPKPQAVVREGTVLFTMECALDKLISALEK